MSEEHRWYKFWKEDKKEPKEKEMEEIIPMYTEPCKSRAELHNRHNEVGIWLKKMHEELNSIGKEMKKPNLSDEKNWN